MWSAANSFSCGQRVPIMIVAPGPALSAFPQTAEPRLAIASVPANAPTADACDRPPSRSPSRRVAGPGQKPKAVECWHTPAPCRLGGECLAGGLGNDLRVYSYLCNNID